MPERLVRDVFPVEVYAPPARPSPTARAFVTTERVAVWVEGTGGLPVLLFERLLEPDAPAPAPDRGSLFGQLHLATDLGPVHVTKITHDCGCHSALRALAPPVSW